jgi:hypothetical protein
VYSTEPLESIVFLQRKHEPGQKELCRVEWQSNEVLSLPFFIPGSETNLGIPQRNVEIPLRKINLPYIAALVPDHQFKDRLVSINPICLTNRISCQPLDCLVRSLQHLEMRTSIVHGPAHQRDDVFVSLLPIQSAYSYDTIPVKQDKVKLGE